VLDSGPRYCCSNPSPLPVLASLPPIPTDFNWNDVTLSDLTLVHRLTLRTGERPVLVAVPVSRPPTTIVAGAQTAAFHAKLTLSATALTTIGDDGSTPNLAVKIIFNADEISSRTAQVALLSWS